MFKQERKETRLEKIQKYGDPYELYRKTISGINDSMRLEKPAQTQEFFDLLSDKFIPFFTERDPHEWVMNPEYLVPGRVYLMAHSIHPERCIGVIEKTSAGDDDDDDGDAEEDSSKPKIKIPEELKYSFRRLVVKEIQEKVEGGSKNKKQRVRSCKRIVFSTKPTTKVCTTKKGLWLIWNPSIKHNINYIDLQFGGQKYQEVIEWYEYWVQGMFKVPSKDFPRNPEDIYFEQFMLGDYPTAEWRDHIQTFKKKNEKRNPRDGSKSVSQLLKNLGCSSSTAAPPPPPPPPAQHQEKKKNTKKRSRKASPEEEEEGERKPLDVDNLPSFADLFLRIAEEEKKKMKIEEERMAALEFLEDIDPNNFDALENIND